MKDSKPENDVSTRRKELFRIQFSELLISKNVSEVSWPWFFRHLEGWSRWLREQKRRASAESLMRWIRELDGIRNLQSFQMNQKLLAIEWAHGEILKEDWVRKVDWEGLRAEQVGHQAGEIEFHSVGRGGAEELFLREGFLRGESRLVGEAG